MFKLRLLPVIILLGAYSFAPGETFFSPSGGSYSTLLKDLRTNLYEQARIRRVQLDGEERLMFISWVRDHVHVMKAYKYWEQDLGSYLSFFLGRQTPRGMYYDYWRSYKDENVGEMYFTNVFDREFYFVDVNHQLFFFRMPIEADLEYLLVEGVYTHWQAGGDRAYLQRWVSTLEKGLKYAMSDPLRWSSEHLLVKRPYSIDTWDFASEPDDATKANRLKYHIGNDEATPKGIMHGDNSGMYQASRQLSAIYTALAEPERALEWDRQAELFRTRMNRLCWNGRYYAHFVPIDPPPKHVATDPREALSLSNTYDINRGVTTRAMASSIIQAYASVWEKTRHESVAEWYGIYPPIAPHFGKYPVGEYVNGAVLPLVGGELAKAAFQNGHEAYGIQILDRVNRIMDLNGRRLPGCVNRDGTRQKEAIPDEWGQAAVVSALVEGLAGVVDRGVQFDSVEVSPRWLFAGVADMEVRIGYGTHTQVKYDYQHDAARQTFTVSLTGQSKHYTLRLPLPPGASLVSATVDGKTATPLLDQVNETNYVVISGDDDAASFVVHYKA